MYLNVLNLENYVLLMYRLCISRVLLFCKSNHINLKSYEEYELEQFFIKYGEDANIRFG